jgi:hypothetical protein
MLTAGECAHVRRATRNKILVWVIFLGLGNFAAYTVTYWYFQGDARNGFVKFEDGEDGREAHYYVRGHFLRVREGLGSNVSRGVWIYSFVHSISIWPTIGAVLVSMFVLARPHIIATIKADAVISGRGFVNVCMLLVILVTIFSTVVFIVNLIQALDAASAGRDFGV